MIPIPRSLYFDLLAARTTLMVQAYIRSGRLLPKDPGDWNAAEQYQYYVAKAIRSKLILMPTDQGRIFLSQPIVEQDYVTWLRLPFDDVFIEFADGAVDIVDDPRGAFEFRAISLHNVRFEVPTNPDPTLIRTWGILFWMNWKDDLPGGPPAYWPITVGVRDDNTIVTPALPDPTDPITPRLRDFAIHMINFLSSPSVKLTPVDDHGTIGRKAAMHTLGIEPPKGPILPHFVEYRKANLPTIATGTGRKHQFQYDVRGHFKRWKIGRVVWCPPHRRGLANRIYRPSIRYVKP